MNLASKLDDVHAKAKANKWLRYFAVFNRIALAAGFIPSGFTKIFDERFTSLSVNHPMGNYLEALYHTGYYYPFIGYIQVIAAILLLIPRTATLGAVLYFPIILNICMLSLAVCFDGSLLTSPLMLLANLYLLGWDYDKLKFILPFKHSTTSDKSIQYIQSNKFPTAFFLGVIAVVAILVIVLTTAYDIKPRNSLSECNNHCKDSDNPTACFDFCDCIHTQGQSYDKCLKEYKKAKKLQARSQPIDSLRLHIQQILSSKNAVVGVAIIGNNGKDTLTINGERHFPMQSVFKFHIGLTMLSEIDKGNFLLDQPIAIQKTDLLPGLYSPIQDKYPEGTTLTIAEILAYTVSLSDNVGCDVLLKLLGGPQTVENYFVNNHFKDISIKINEEVMQNNWDLQFLNWTTPKAANQVLESFYYNTEKWLSQESHGFIWKLMRETSTGVNRLKGQLPIETVVAHKTGWSGTNKVTGITAAVNDIGIVFLPNGQHFFISIFVTDSTEDTAANELIIADIAKAVWDYFSLEGTR